MNLKKNMAIYKERRLVHISNNMSKSGFVLSTLGNIVYYHNFVNVEKDY